MQPIFCDVDGVCIDFISGALKIFNERYSTEFTYDDCYDDIRKLFPSKTKEFDRMVQTEGFCYNLPIMPEAVEAIRKLMNKHHVIFATKPYNDAPHWFSERIQKLRELFDISREQVIFIGDKRYLSGQVLIEDKFENAIEWSEYNQKNAILILQLWNKQQIKKSKFYCDTFDNLASIYHFDSGSFEIFNDWKGILQSFDVG